MNPALASALGLLARHALTLFGGYFAAKGTMDAETFNTIAGGAAAVVAAGWSWNQKKRSGATVAP